MNRADAPNTPRPSPGSARRARAFTLVELLVTIAIIGVLIAMLGLAVRGAFSASTSAQTQGMLNTIGQAVTTFQTDLSYEPPLISRIEPGQPSGSNTGGIFTPELWAQSTGNAADARAEYLKLRYSSQFSLPVYLMGMGNINGVTDNTQGVPNTTAIKETDPTFRARAQHDGVPGPGLRNPGPLKAWKRVENINGTATIVHAPEVSGRSYGPYLDPEQMSKLLEAVEVDPQTMRRKLAFNTTPSGIRMYRLIDPYGNPIRYYRGWPTTDPTQNNAPSVKRIPIELREASAVNAELANANPTGNPLEADRPLMGAKYVLLAPNAPRQNAGVAAAATTPFEDEVDQVLEESMPYIGASVPPSFNPGLLGGGDGADKVRRLKNFANKAIRRIPQ